MEQAIQAALNIQAGTVLESRLGREGDTVVYHVLILDGDGSTGTVTIVEVSALDGHITRSKKEHLEEKNER